MFYSQCIRLFDQCLSLITELSNITQTQIIQTILILTKKSFCHIQTGEYMSAQHCISASEHLYRGMTNAYGSLHSLNNIAPPPDSSSSFFLDIFQYIPHEILQQIIWYHKALINICNFEFNKAVRHISKIITQGQKFDSQIRQSALAVLRNIFDRFRLVEDLAELRLLQNKMNLREIDVIIMIDYSKSMTRDQLKISHTSCKVLFDLLNPDDKIGFIVFNEMIHQSFPLQRKKYYKELLEKQVRSISQFPG